MCAPCSRRSLIAICAARGTDSAVTFPIFCPEKDSEAWLHAFAPPCVATTAAVVVTPLHRKLRLVQLIVSLLLLPIRIRAIVARTWQIQSLRQQTVEGHRLQMTGLTLCSINHDLRSGQPSE